MLAHLKSTYGKITPEDLEANRSMLSAVWNPDNPMEDFWVRIKEVQRFATAGHKPSPTPPLCDSLSRFLKPLASSHLPLKNGVIWMRLSGLYQCTSATSRRPTRSAFANSLLKTAGYHGAHAAIASHPPALPAPVAATTSAPTPFQITTDGQQFFYCWLHGLGTNRSHSSATCNQPSPGHQLTATARHMLGGNNTILRGGQAPPCCTNNSAALTTGEAFSSHNFLAMQF